MSNGPREIDGGGYTFSGDVTWTQPAPVELVYECSYFDNGAHLTYPVRGGEIIGGCYDGLRLASPTPKLPFDLDPEHIAFRIEP